MTCLSVTVGVNNVLTWQNPGHREEDGENCEEREDGVGSLRDILSESVRQVVPQALARSHT